MGKQTWKDQSEGWYGIVAAGLLCFVAAMAVGVALGIDGWCMVSSSEFGSRSYLAESCRY